MIALSSTLLLLIDDLILLVTSDTNNWLREVVKNVWRSEMCFGDENIYTHNTKSEQEG